MNIVLEENRVPVIWISNHGNTETLTPAYWTPKLAALTTLALGDFAVADKQAHWRTDAHITPEWLLDVITQQVRQKKVPCHIAPIGFHVGMGKGCVW